MKISQALILVWSLSVGTAGFAQDRASSAIGLFERVCFPIVNNVLAIPADDGDGIAQFDENYAADGSRESVKWRDVETGLYVTIMRVDVATGGFFCEVTDWAEALSGEEILRLERSIEDWVPVHLPIFRETPLKPVDGLKTARAWVDTRYALEDPRRSAVLFTHSVGEVTSVFTLALAFITPVPGM